jgi:hypothetical protein
MVSTREQTAFYTNSRNYEKKFPLLQDVLLRICAKLQEKQFSFPYEKIPKDNNSLCATILKL